MTQIVGIFKMVFQSVFEWFDSLLTTSGGGTFYLSMIAVFLVYKFMLAPIFGSSRGSDTAAKSRRDKDKAIGG